MEIYPSARRRQISDEDIRHAYESDSDVLVIHAMTLRRSTQGELFGDRD